MLNVKLLVVHHVTGRLMRFHIRNARTNSFHIFQQQENLLHFKDKLHNLCSIFNKMLQITLFYLFLFKNIYFYFLNHARKCKNSPGCLNVNTLSRCIYKRSTITLTQCNSPVSREDLLQPINMHFHVILSSTPRSPKRSSPASFLTKTFLFFSTRGHTLRLSHPS